MPKSRIYLRLLLVVSFLLVAALQAWPLPIQLSTHLTGDPGGDTGVYVWNLWVFNHEVLRLGWPWTTDVILPLGGLADLTQHNYTVAANLLALPMLAVLDVVTTFNIVYMVNAALCGLGACLLVRRVVATSTNDWTVAWLAGFLFLASPFLVARSTAHFSLAAAAALPLFAYFVDRILERPQVRDGVMAGVCLAWAAYSDPYYFVYGCLLGGAMTAARALSLSWSRRPVPLPARRVVDVLLILGMLVIGARLVVGTESFTVAGRSVSMRTLYTPVLVLTILTLLRMAFVWQLRFSWTWPLATRRVLVALGVTGAVAVVLMAPTLVGLLIEEINGQFVSVPVLWRSSAPGVDLLAFLLPNPNHPLAPDALVSWFAMQPARFEENVLSIPWTALGVMFLAWRLAAWRPHPLWAAVAVGSLLVALGPFIRIGGLDTHVPGPWAIVRYLPIVGEARMPPRFGVLTILAVSVLFGSALVALRAWSPNRARAITWAVAAVLAFELLPAPRTLYSAAVPPLYDVIASDKRDVRVLELPLGVRDGLSSLGDFSARSQLFQTRHEKPLIGGYLSRVSTARQTQYQEHPYLGVVLEGSAGRPIDESRRTAAAGAAASFVDDLRVGYVVIDHARTTKELEQFVTSTLALRHLANSGSLSLYVPTVGSSGRHAAGEKRNR